jgi:hypothetical protein
MSTTGWCLTALAVLFALAYLVTAVKLHLLRHKASVDVSSLAAALMRTSQLMMMAEWAVRNVCDMTMDEILNEAQPPEDMDELTTALGYPTRPEVTD